MVKRVPEDADMNAAYPVQYEHQGCKWHGIVNDWDDMQHLVGLVVRFSPCNPSGQTLTHIILEGTLIKVEVVIEGDIEPVYLVLKPMMVAFVGTSRYSAPPQIQFQENTFDQYSIYFASNDDY